MTFTGFFYGYFMCNSVIGSGSINYETGGISVRYLGNEVDDTLEVLQSIDSEIVSQTLLRSLAC